MFALDDRAATRFWKHVTKGDSCWVSDLKGRPEGYPVFKVVTADGSLSVKAHRVSWVLANGDIPDGLFVLHRCDNKKCVRPDHLFLGTHQDNMDDMAAKGRRVVNSNLFDPVIKSSMLEKANNQQSREKRIQTLRKIGHAQGKSNSQFGTVWITDGVSNKKCKGDIPDGWYKGRKM